MSDLTKEDKKELLRLVSIKLDLEFKEKFDKNMKNAFELDSRLDFNNFNYDSKEKKK